MYSRQKRTRRVKHLTVKLPILMHPEQTMTILTNSTNDIRGLTDFVLTDNAALACHMYDCASRRSRLFSLQAALEIAHSVIFGRVVTAAVLALAMLVLVGVV